MNIDIGHKGRYIVNNLHGLQTNYAFACGRSGLRRPIRNGRKFYQRLQNILNANDAISPYAKIVVSRVNVCPIIRTVFFLILLLKMCILALSKWKLYV